jgi:hypothetical protein
MPPTRPSVPQGNLFERFQKRILIPLRQQLRSWLQSLASGDQQWARMRLVFAILFSLILIIFMFTLVDALGKIKPPVDGAEKSFLDRLLDFVVNGGSMIATVIGRLLDLIKGPLKYNAPRFRYALAPFIAALIVLLYGGRYIQDVYELTRYENALRYFLSSIFGLPQYERLRIENGAKQLAAGAENTLDKIGGPGYVIIAPGNVVLFERLTGPAAVRAAGTHFVSRFERIAAIVNLDEQIGQSSHKATTREGIPVEARNASYRFRLLPGKRFSGPAGRAMINPYPFSTKAVVDMAYNRNVRGDGLMSWGDAVKNAIDTAITAYISGTTLDKLISPSLISGDLGDVTREIVQKSLYSSGTRTSFRNLGAELLFCDIGHFAINDTKIEETVKSQRTNTWKARWIGVANKTRSDADAQRHAFQDLARAEVQAEMLVSIAHALEDAGLNKDGSTLDNLDNIILMRTAQIIEAISDQGRRLNP